MQTIHKAHEKKDLELMLKEQPDLKTIAIAESAMLLVKDYKNAKNTFPFFKNICDCLGIVIELGNDMLLFHKFRADSGSDIQSKLYNIFNQEKYNLNDIKRIVMFGGSDDYTHVVSKEDKISAVSGKNSYKPDFDEIKKRVSGKLKNGREKGYRYESGMISMLRDFTIEDKYAFFSLDISDDEHGKFTSYMYMTEKDKNITISNVNKKVFMSSFVSALTKSLNENDDEKVKITEDSVKEFLNHNVKFDFYNTEIEVNVHFDLQTDALSYVKIDNLGLLDTYLIYKKRRLNPKIFTKFKEDENLYNTEYCDEVNMKKIDVVSNPEFYEVCKKTMLESEPVLDLKNSRKSLNLKSKPFYLG